jgi:hypothetical protein
MSLLAESRSAVAIAIYAVLDLAAIAIAIA